MSSVSGAERAAAGGSGSAAATEGGAASGGGAAGERRGRGQRSITLTLHLPLLETSLSGTVSLAFSVQRACWLS